MIGCINSRSETFSNYIVQTVNLEILTLKESFPSYQNNEKVSEYSINYVFNAGKLG